MKVKQIGRRLIASFVLAAIAVGGAYVIYSLLKWDFPSAWLYVFGIAWAVLILVSGTNGDISTDNDTKY